MNHKLAKLRAPKQIDVGPMRWAIIKIASNFRRTQEVLAKWPGGMSSFECEDAKREKEKERDRERERENEENK